MGKIWSHSFVTETHSIRSARTLISSNRAKILKSNVIIDFKGWTFLYGLVLMGGTVIGHDEPFQLRFGSSCVLSTLHLPSEQRWISSTEIWTWFWESCLDGWRTGSSKSGVWSDKNVTQSGPVLQKVDQPWRTSKLVFVMTTN